MTRFLPLLLVFFLCTCGSGSTEPVESAQEFETNGNTGTGTRPNILFIFTDDHAYDALGALGNTIIETPNLDRLVTSGTTFTHAYNMGAWQPAVCLASRAMLNTGRSVWNAEALDARRKSGDTTAMANNWGPLMQRAGYATYFSGKWHVAAPAAEQFETVAHVRPGMPNDNYPFGKMKALFVRHAPQRPPLDSVIALFPRGYNRPLHQNDPSWDAANPQYGGFWEGGKHWSEVVGDDGVAFLEQATKDERPFFMYLAFNAPHDPRQAPQEYLDRYALENMPVSANFQARYPYDEQIGLGPGVRDEDLAPYPRTELAVRAHTREYYAAITHLDAQVGRILAALEASGKANNTVILFTADHGLAIGKHGLFGKQNLYEHSTRVPLAITGPGIPAGKTIDANVYLQDVMPTALELAGVERPAAVEFRSLLPVISGKDSGLEAVYGAYVNHQRSITRDGWKLIVYPNISVQRLYNLNTDPFELEDLAGQPAFAKREAELLSELAALQQAMGDNLAVDGR